MDLSHYRAEFPTLARKTYLNTCSLGALSNRVRAAANTYLDNWTDHGASAWYEMWIGELQRTREKFARLIGAAPDEVAWTPSVSQALSSLGSALHYVKRNDVVVADLDFPTIPQQWMVKPGVNVRWMKSEDGIGIPASTFTGSMNEHTAVLATSRVYYATGFVQDAKTLSQAAAQAGAFSIIDDYQGTGQIPIDVKDVGCDALVSGSLKWLCGGTGSCFLYVKRERIPELEPTITGWWANEHMFEFDAHKFAWRNNAQRFELGEVNMAGVFTAGAALDLILEIGPTRIQAATQTLVQDLIDRLQDAKFEIRSPVQAGPQRSGIVMVGMEDPARVVKQLDARGIIVDYRPGKVRISPYFYNTVEENERIVDALKALR